MVKCECCDKDINLEGEGFGRSVDPTGNDDSIYYTCAECMEKAGDNCMCPLCKTGHHVDIPDAYYLMCDSCADSVDLPDQPWEEGG